MKTYLKKAFKFYHEFGKASITLLFLVFYSTYFARAELSNSVSLHDIRWYFDTECGKFITGFVTITYIDPAQITDRNKSVLNVPSRKGHVWDDRAGNFDDNLRGQFPLTLSGLNSLTSTISIITDNCTSYEMKSRFSSRFGHCYLTNNQTLAVLTIVNNLVSEVSFRPSYIGVSNKEILNISDVDLIVLSHLPVLNTQTDINLLMNVLGCDMMN